MAKKILTGLVLAGLSVVAGSALADGLKFLPILDPAYKAGIALVTAAGALAGARCLRW